VFEIGDGLSPLSSWRRKIGTPFSSALSGLRAEGTITQGLTARLNRPAAMVYKGLNYSKADDNTESSLRLKRSLLSRVTLMMVPKCAS
jgi:hypothetical protein